MCYNASVILFLLNGFITLLHWVLCDKITILNNHTTLQLHISIFQSHDIILTARRSFIYILQNLNIICRHINLATISICLYILNTVYTLQTLCILYTHCVYLTNIVYTLQTLCVHYKHCVYFTNTVYTLHTKCIPYKHCVYITNIVYTLQTLCIPYTQSVYLRLTNTVYTLQTLCIQYKHCVYITHTSISTEKKNKINK